MLAWELRRPRVPSKLRIAEEDAATKPPEVCTQQYKCTYMRLLHAHPTKLTSITQHIVQTCGSYRSVYYHAQKVLAAGIGPTSNEGSIRRAVFMQISISQ